MQQVTAPSTIVLSLATLILVSHIGLATAAKALAASDVTTSAIPKEAKTPIATAKSAPTEPAPQVAVAKVAPKGSAAPVAAPKAAPQQPTAPVTAPAKTIPTEPTVPLASSKPAVAPVLEQAQKPIKVEAPQPKEAARPVSIEVPDLYQMIARRRAVRARDLITRQELFQCRNAVMIARSPEVQRQILKLTYVRLGQRAWDHGMVLVENGNVIIGGHWNRLDNKYYMAEPISVSIATNNPLINSTPTATVNHLAEHPHAAVVVTHPGIITPHPVGVVHHPMINHPMYLQPHSMHPPVAH